jgi:hypothetical protein
MRYWNSGRRLAQGPAAWRASVALACRWIMDRSMITAKDHGFADSDCEHLRRYQDWRGAFRGEYAAASGRWDVLCPIWHGGQGVKALALAYAALGDELYLRAARAAADFILRNQVNDPCHPEHGMIIGTFFYVQAVCRLLCDLPELLE